MATLDPMEG
jgi:hypothetical protein